MNLSRNFTLAELVHSQTAARRGLDNTPPPEVVAELERLARTVLQPLRDRLARPIVVSSGYRSPAVNRAVGGARESAHLFGRAADITVPGMTSREVCKAIVDGGLPFDQCIDEFGSWCHVAIAASVPRRQQLEARRAANGRTVYRTVTF